MGFEEFIIQKCFQRLEPTEKKPQGHFEGNTPVEFEGVVISMIWKNLAVSKTAYLLNAVMFFELFLLKYSTKSYENLKYSPNFHKLITLMQPAR